MWLPPRLETLCLMILLLGQWLLPLFLLLLQFVEQLHLPFEPVCLLLFLLLVLLADGRLLGGGSGRRRFPPSIVSRLGLLWASVP